MQRNLKPMTLLYADKQKEFGHYRGRLYDYKTDDATGQNVGIDRSVLGTRIHPDRQWTPFCEKLYVKYGANGVRLSDITVAPNQSLEFVNHLQGCERLRIQDVGKIDLSPLAGNKTLVDLELPPFGTFEEFDLSTLPNLRRCDIPLIPQLRSFIKCQKLDSLRLTVGKHEGVLNLEPLTELREFQCLQIKKLTGVRLNPKVRLLSLVLTGMKDFELLEPLNVACEELRVVRLDKVPKFNIDWLSRAEKVECISLGLKLPSIKFLGGLKKLQVLCLFGSKVEDGDFSVRDALKNELDRYLWGNGQNVRKESFGMGTWSCEPFGNDTAGDWAFGLDEAKDLSYVEAALDTVLEQDKDDELEATDSEEAIAACEVLAKLLGKGTQSDGYTQGVDTWVASLTLKPDSALLKKAQKVLKRVVSKNSELRELWEEEGAGDWKKSIKALRDALNG
jgi:Domain of unknown function (DUF4259)